MPESASKSGRTQMPISCLPNLHQGPMGAMSRQRAGTSKTVRDRESRRSSWKAAEPQTHGGATPTSLGIELHRGTMVGDALFGAQNGISKRLDPVICLTEHPLEGERYEWTLAIITAVERHIVQNGLQTRAVVNFSGSFNHVTETEEDKEWNNPIEEAWKRLCDLGVLIVAAGAAEDESGLGRTARPQELALELPIVVVDATDIDGRQMYQRDPRSTIAACGIGKSLASHETPGSYLPAHGTSFATPIVSGLAANILSLLETEQVRTLVPLDQFIRYLKAFIESLAYPTVDEGPKVAWNGVGHMASERAMGDDGSWGQTFLGFVLEKLTQAVAETLPVKMAK